MKNSPFFQSLKVKFNSIREFFEKNSMEFLLTFFLGLIPYRLFLLFGLEREESFFWGFFFLALIVAFRKAITLFIFQSFAFQFVLFWLLYLENLLFSNPILFLSSCLLLGYHYPSMGGYFLFNMVFLFWFLGTYARLKKFLFDPTTYEEQLGVELGLKTKKEFSWEYAVKMLGLRTSQMYGKSVNNRLPSSFVNQRFPGAVRNMMFEKLARRLSENSDAYNNGLKMIGAFATGTATFFHLHVHIENKKEDIASKRVILEDRRLTLEERKQMFEEAKISGMTDYLDARMKEKKDYVKDVEVILDPVELEKRAESLKKHAPKQISLVSDQEIQVVPLNQSSFFDYFFTI